jgi:peptidoglycan hydrolase-like protein with peptidoglycan-binding domain
MRNRNEAWHQRRNQAGHIQRGSRACRALCCLLILCCVWTSSVAPALAEQTGKVTATQLNIRKSASSNAEKLRSVKKGTSLTILGTEGGWYKVRFGKVVGYVAKEYVSVSGKASSSSGAKSGSTVASLGSAPKASKPGDTNNSVKKLQEALTITGYYNGKISGNYGDLTEKAVRSFQKAKGLAVDGIAGNGTIKALFGSSAAGSSSGASAGSTAKTEKPNWFTTGKNLIPKNAVFTIKDVRSGRTFQARRWSGGNHIDAEPYSKSDTDMMKKCYGGSWSWARRPVLIKYNGHVYAASMNGMPHGNPTIKNNGFGGVFCVHFYMSKTHETNRVDPLHQACIKEAAKATW